jgi:predicted transcriptional regulator
MNSNSRTYLEAFIAIEHYLAERCDLPRGAPFTQLVDTLAKQHATVRYMADDLKAFARLRNVIVHERGGGQVLAEPNDWAVRRIQQIAELLIKPPTVAMFTRRRVMSVSHTTTVCAAMALMAKHHYSQLPVFQGQHYMGLLTTRTLTYWIGSQPAPFTNVCQTLVAEVLQSAEHWERAHFVAVTSELTEILELFADHNREKGHLDAILITHDGHSSSDIIGIIVAADIVHISAELKLYNE